MCDQSPFLHFLLSCCSSEVERQDLSLLKRAIPNCSDFPSEAMLWIKEVEMVDSLDELGKDFPNFEMLDAKIASALNKIILNSHFKKKGQSGGAESPERGPVSARKTDRLHDLRLLSSEWRS